MKLKDKVTNLRLSKRLKELGYPQKGLFWWTKRVFSNNEIVVWPWLVGGGEFEPRICVAPTVAELGKRLAKSGSYGSWYTGNEWAVTEIFSKEFPELDSDTEANARAKMLIWLVENGHVSFEEKEEIEE